MECVETQSRVVSMVAMSSCSDASRLHQDQPEQNQMQRAAAVARVARPMTPLIRSQHLQLPCACGPGDWCRDGHRKWEVERDATHSIAATRAASLFRCFSRMPVTLINPHRACASHWHRAFVRSRRRGGREEEREGAGRRGKEMGGERGARMTHEQQAGSRRQRETCDCMAEGDMAS